MPRRAEIEILDRTREPGQEVSNRFLNVAGSSYLVTTKCLTLPLEEVRGWRENRVGDTLWACRARHDR